MASFDFITESDFRTSLETDFGDMKKAFEAQSWKVVHVLAGSIIEAVLTDYLISANYQKNKGTDPLKLNLGQIITSCREEGSISDRAVELSNVIRSYRNLIHPGRMKRLKESIDKNTAQVAISLVEIVVDEIEKCRSRNYGLTAEQLVRKVEDDRSSLPILNHLLDAAHEKEIERLLLNVLPGRYFELSDYQYDDVSEDQSNLAMCFRRAFERSSEPTKLKVCEKYLGILREAEGHTVLTYETEFFRCTDLAYLNDSTRQLAKDHILSRLQKDSSSSVLIALEGISSFLHEDEVMAFVDPLIKVIILRSPPDDREIARSRLHEATGLAPPENREIRDSVLKRLNDWIKHSEDREATDTLKILKDLESDLELPF